ncbi:fumarate hydratase [[Brevibacterium] frigoritolerans]|uniref:Fumarate hydratase n=1 Tax=Peribacillus frigoritolerans TaxID=450367 RepID=A0A941FPV1_9BACI|nr:fumarate hydratase [Peribacillus frigoritolerans]
MRPVGSRNENENAAKMEKLLEDGINAIGLGPQGLKGSKSVMGVNVVNTARHPSTIELQLIQGAGPIEEGKSPLTVI